MTNESYNSSVITKDSVVQMAYSITDRNGRIIEARTSENPVEFICGHGQILKSLEEKLIGQVLGFKGDFKFDPDQAHGEYKKELVVEMKREQFPEGMEIKKGMKFESTGPDGEAVALHVMDVKDDVVLIDGNHPLAGEELNFSITILEIREAAKEEIAQGQALTNMEVESKTVH